MDNDALVATLHSAACPCEPPNDGLCVDQLRAAEFVAALGANGYVPVPRHLLARMADAYKADDTTALIWAARAVVEAVGPTTPRITKCPACTHAGFRHTNGCEVCDCRLTFRAVGPTREDGK